jgi:sugar transferase (PEP-CTERM/EpsH1 system associated)
MSNTKVLRILILTPSVPYPPNWGFGIRVYQFIRYLAQAHEVTVLTYASPQEADKVETLARTGATVHALPPPFAISAGKRRAQALSLLAAKSYQTSSLTTRPMQEMLDRLLSERPYDIVQVESSQLSGFTFQKGPILVLDEHNLEYELLYRMYQTEMSPLRRVYNLLEYLKFRREEQASWHKADACILTSEREQAILTRHLPGKTAVVAPNGVDIDYFQPNAAEEVPDSLVFTGLISYRPNTDAVLYFAREILPLILRQRPGAKFIIVGMGATEEVRALAGPHVVVTGQVPDVRPYVHQASAFVVPLRMGSGTRLKVLEGLAMGKPMVSTTLGCEGISVQDSRHLLMADDPQSFASAVVRLLEDRDLASRLGQAGRSLVERAYSWPSVVEILEHLYRQMLDRMPAPTKLPGSPHAQEDTGYSPG